MPRDVHAFVWHSPCMVHSAERVDGGNGAVFQLVPQRFRKEIGVMTGLVGMAGGIGGLYLASSLGLSRQATGSYQPGLCVFASLALLALVGLSVVKGRWRTTWGSAAMTTAKI